MLDGEIRFGKDWVDQVAQISSWGYYCHGHTVRARAHVWACVRVALCACLSVRASWRLYIFEKLCTSIHSSTHTYDVIHIDTHYIHESSDTFKMNAHQCSFFFLNFFQQHTTFCKKKKTSRCIYIHIYTCLCACYVCIYGCVYECVPVCDCVVLCSVRVSCVCLVTCRRSPFCVGDAECVASDSLPAQATPSPKGDATHSVRRHSSSTFGASRGLEKRSKLSSWIGVRSLLPPTVEIYCVAACSCACCVKVKLKKIHTGWTSPLT